MVEASDFGITTSMIGLTKNIIISKVKSDSYGYFYCSKQTGGTNIDEKFLKPANAFDSDPDDESEISQPQMHSFLSEFKVV